MTNPPPRSRTDVVFRQVGKEWLLYDPSTDEIHVLNLSAALIWSCLDGTRDVEALASEIEVAFRIEDGAEAVRNALEEFEEKGLLDS